MILEVEDLHAGYGRIPVLMGTTLAAEETGILGILATTAWVRPRYFAP